MKEYDLITRMLHEDFLCKDGEGNVMIENQGNEHAVQRVNIVNSVRAISRMSLFRFDVKKTGKDFLPFLANSNTAPLELRSFCDYVLLVECRDNLYILLIELKRGDHLGYRKQIDGANCFMDYIISSAMRIRSVNGFNDFDRHNIHYRRVLLKKCKSEKEETHNVDLPFSKNDYIEIRCKSEFRPIRVI